jgi:hypothetical protein
MISRGFKHSHPAIYPPVFRRIQPAKNDLLPWVDPYITSLFHPDAELVSEAESDDETLFPSRNNDDDEAEPTSHR